MSDSIPVRDAAAVGTMIQQADAGDAPTRDALFASLYSELHRLAQAHLRSSGGHLTIGATTLLHELYVDLTGRASVAFPDRLRFLKYASRAMRGLIIDYVRMRRALKRGGDITFTSVEQAEVHASQAAPLEALGHALDELSALDASLAEVVDLKFFCGFSFGEIAAMRGISERTVQRDWAKARVLLHRTLTSASGAESDT